MKTKKVAKAATLQVVKDKSLLRLFELMQEKSQLEKQMCQVDAELRIAAAINRADVIAYLREVLKGDQ
jgi:hypothetical protein